VADVSLSAFGDARGDGKEGAGNNQHKQLITI
jgi:hypothetical protein